jgi:hypothetical protein
MFAGVNAEIFSKQKKKKGRKEATFKELAETSSSDGLSTV